MADKKTPTKTVPIQYARLASTKTRHRGNGPAPRNKQRLTS